MRIPDPSYEESNCEAMVWELGLEPRTLGLENRCSIQLSYTHIDILKLVKEPKLARKSNNENQVSDLRNTQLG